MLSIRNAEEADFGAFNAYLAKETLELSHIDFSVKETMLLVDGDDIIGFAYAGLVAFKPTIEGIYIPKILRGHLLGDAVLRGLLYYFMNRGFDRVYAPKDAIFSDFLAHAGFEACDEGLVTVLNDFFDRKCRGCRDSEQ